MFQFPSLRNAEIFFQCDKRFRQPDFPPPQGHAEIFAISLQSDPNTMQSELCLYTVLSSVFLFLFSVLLLYFPLAVTKWGCGSVGSVSDRHAADAGSIPRCGKGFFFRSQLSLQTLLRYLYTPVCNRMHLHLCARLRSRSPCQSLVDYGDAKTPSMHRRLGSAILSQLSFPGESNPNGETQEGHYSC